MSVQKKSISSVRIAGREFLLKAENRRSGSLYPRQGFARDALLSSLLWRHGICPETLALRGRMLQEKVGGARGLDFSRDAALAGKLLARLHTVHASKKMKGALEKKDYAQQAFSSGLGASEKRELLRRYPGLLAKLEELWKTIRKTPARKGRKCICHNDCVAQNFLIAGKSAYLIDFEWASYGYCEADLACFLSPLCGCWSGQELRPKDARAFIAAYCRARGEGMPGVMRRVEQAAPYVRFSHLCWAARILLSQDKVCGQTLTALESKFQYNEKKRALGKREKFELEYAKRCLGILGRI